MDAVAVFERMKTLKIIPVVAIDAVKDALPLADALIAGGLPVAEITYRTAAAADVIRLLRRERPDMLVGAGTVLTAEQVASAKGSGAQFAVSPGVNPAVVQAAQAAGLPFGPGVMTPSDIEVALGLGLRVMKFFPAEPMGGLKTLKSIAAPYMHLGVRFIPLGGVSVDNVAAYLKDPAVMAVGGTWLAKKEDIAGGRWDVIRENCVKAMAAANHS